MGRLRVLVYVALGVTCFCGLLAAQAQPQTVLPHGLGQLEVTVVDGQDKPLAGALVAFLDS